MLANLDESDIAVYRERLRLWVSPSHAALAGTPEEDEISNLHGLAAIDAELFLEEARSHSGKDPYANDPLQQARLLTLSELWVLGSYEFVRRWADALRAREGEKLKSEYRLAVVSLRTTFERVRIPLAKAKPAKHAAQAGDFGYALRAIHPDKSVGWALAENSFVSRRDLGDKFIDGLQLLAYASREPN